MFNLYYVRDNQGNKHLMSAKKIYNIATNPSDGVGYDFLTNVKSLLSIYNNDNFPEEYVLPIKNSILNFYAKLLYSNDSVLKDNKGNLRRVCNIYNDLFGSIDEDTIKARENYLMAYLEYLTNLFKKDSYNRNFYKIAEAWRNREFKRLIKEKNIDFYAIKDELKKSFKDRIKFCEEANLLVKEEVIVPEEPKKKILEEEAK